VIVRLLDGRVTGIGRVCGQKYFPDSWGELSRDFSARKAAVEQREQISELGKQTAYFAAKLSELEPRLTWYSRAVRSLESLPRPVLAEIEKRTKDNDYEVTTRREIADEAEFKRLRMFNAHLKITDRITVTVGKLRPARFLEHGRSAEHIAKYQVASVLRRAGSSDFADRRTLRDVARSVAELPRLLDVAEYSIRELQVFLTIENLALIPLLKVSRAIGLDIVRLKGDGIEAVFAERFRKDHK
jgi:hypothetical protein